MVLPRLNLTTRVIEIHLQVQRPELGPVFFGAQLSALLEQESRVSDRKYVDCGKLDQSPDELERIVV